ncbi:MAG: hypothetical protein SFY80_00705 [Verrucomicrobiota bacterium]|nr:hypothetical protein [Verrucomicrobiota bacterium]
MAILLCIASPLAAQLQLPTVEGVTTVENERVMLVFWNGEEEIILSCPVITATQPSDVLQIMPLPAESKMRAGTLDEYQAAGALIRKYFVTMKGGRLSLANYELAESLPKGDRTEAKEVATVNLSNERAFNTWLTDYSKPASRPNIPSAFSKGLNLALKNDSNWLAIQSVPVDTTARAIGPTVYRFKSSKLFVPLRVHSTQSGKANIRIITFTPNYLSWSPDNGAKFCPPITESFRVMGKEVAAIHPDLVDFFKPGKIPMQAWQITADWSLVNKDLISQ